METLEALKKLKLEYERLRDQYFLTRSDLHYMQFQQGFKEYRSFIDRHNIAPSEIEKVIAVDFKESPVSKASPPPPPRALESERKVLEFMGMQEDFIAVDDMTSFVPLSISEIRRYLYRLHGQGLVEYHYERGCHLWRKKSVHD